MAEQVKNLLWMVAFAGAGVLLPAITNLFQVEQVFLSMYIPVLVAGFVFSIYRAVAIAVIIPILNTILFSYPSAIPSLPLVICQMIACAAFANLLYCMLEWKRYPALLLTMAMGIIVLFCAAAIYGAVSEGFIGSFYVAETILNGWPGLLLQVAVVPPLVKLMERLIYGQPQQSDMEF